MFYALSAAVLIISIALYRRHKHKQRVDAVAEHITLPVFEDGRDPVKDRYEIRYVKRRDD